MGEAEGGEARAITWKPKNHVETVTK